MPDPVEKQLTLLGVHKFVVEALGGFALDRASRLIAEAAIEYPLDRDHWLNLPWSPGLGVCDHRRGHFFIRRPYSSTCVDLCKHLW